jgi:hypothetical protein
VQGKRAVLQIGPQVMMTDFSRRHARTVNADEVAVEAGGDDAHGHGHGHAHTHDRGCSYFAASQDDADAHAHSHEHTHVHAHTHDHGEVHGHSASRPESASACGAARAVPSGHERSPGRILAVEILKRQCLGLI